MMMKWQTILNILKVIDIIAKAIKALKAISVSASRVIPCRAYVSTPTVKAKPQRFYQSCNGNNEALGLQPPPDQYHCTPYSLRGINSVLTGLFAWFLTGDYDGLSNFPGPKITLSMCQSSIKGLNNSRMLSPSKMKGKSKG